MSLRHLPISGIVVQQAGSFGDDEVGIGRNQPRRAGRDALWTVYLHWELTRDFHQEGTRWDGNVS
ncbi:MAG: hypothetical protein ABWZ75_00950 [Novosphingobium sp.]